MSIKITDEMLLGVKKPARYIGEELNIIKKDWEKTKTKIVLCFPDVYEIGMSHLGLRILYHLLNERDDILCERAFSPWIDFEKVLREKNIPLYSLESYHSLADFDIIGFSINYELSYSNVLNILSLAKIPLLSAERDEKYPLVIAGGSVSFNPEPLCEFIDAFVVGEGEEVIFEVIETYEKYKENKKILLCNLAKIEGVYVPSLYNVEYFEDGKIKKFYPVVSDIPQKIKKRYICDFENCFFPTKPIVPFVEIVHDRITIEIMRGCPHKCNFCQAQKIYRPVRKRGINKILQIAKESIENTGYEEISLLSLSTGDYPHVDELIEKIICEFYHKRVSVSVPSLRVDKIQDKKFAEIIRKIKKTGFTFAPEVATDKMRKIVNKNIKEDELISSIKNILSLGWRNFKLYFMIGLPDESEEDVLAIPSLVKKILNETKGFNLKNISVTISSFVPKPHTPFERKKQETMETILAKQKIILNELHHRKLQIKYHDVKKSFLEGIFSRGDRKLNKVLMTAHNLGCRFDTWDEVFDFDMWMSAFKKCNINPEFYLRDREEDEILPWGHIET